MEEGRVLMDSVKFPDNQPGVLCADEKRYHANASVLGLSFPFPVMVSFRGKTYIACSTISDDKGDFLRVTYKCGEDHFFIVHNETVKKD